MSTVEIYTSPDCHACKILEKKFAAFKVPFVKHDFSEVSEAQRVSWREQGFKSKPFVRYQDHGQTKEFAGIMHPDRKSVV